MMEETNEPMMDQQNDARTAPVKRQSPGALLVEARTARKMTQEDVNKQLRINLQWVKDLETDDYSRAAALIYVRGHLRSYARLVGIPAEVIMAAFDSLGTEETFNRERPDVIRHQAVPIISKSSRVFISRRIIRWTSASMAVVLVILVGIWWQGQKKHGVDHQATMALQPKQELPVQANVGSSDDKAAPEATPSQATAPQIQNSQAATPATTPAPTQTEPAATQGEEDNNASLPPPTRHHRHGRYRQQDE